MRIGIIGSGNIGATVGKLWVDAGHDVRFSSRHPDDLSEAHRKGHQVGIPLAGDEFEPDTPPYNTGTSGRELRKLFG